MENISGIISYAIEAHHSTNHLYDGKPYSVHLSMVALNGVRYIDCIPEQSQFEVLAACWLHDTIEDCRLTYNDIKSVAGENVANIVYALTNEKGKNRKERANDLYYDGIRKIMWAKYVKLCDRLANAQYSLDTQSKMHDVYRKENRSFLKSLFPNESEMAHYRDIVRELNLILGI